MLAIYIGLQLFVLILGIKVLRIHWWLRHLQPNGSFYLNLNFKLLPERINEYYDNVCWYPQA